MKTPWYMRVWVWLLVLVVIIAIPFFINEAYKCETGYATKWSAADVLSFYGSLLSLGGSVVLGIVAVEQSRKANELAERMLTLEEQKEVPIIDIIEIADGKEPTDSNVLRNALRLSVNVALHITLFSKVASRAYGAPYAKNHRLRFSRKR